VEAVQEWERRWEIFDAQTGRISMKDVPLPPTQVLLRAGSEKVEYKKLVLRFHPDKWLQKYQHRINKEDEASMMEQITQTFQTINNIRQRQSFSFVQVG